MNGRLKITLALTLTILVSIPATLAQAPPEIKAKFDAKVKQLETFSTDPKVVSAVKAYNAATPSEEAKNMTNEKWHNLSVFDPFVRSVGKSPLSEYLKTKRDDEIAKIFCIRRRRRQGRLRC